MNSEVERFAAFAPARWLPGCHLQTIFPSLCPAPAVGPATETHIVEVAPGNSVQVRLDRPEGPARGTVLLLHGMCGSSESGYMRRTARVALARGFAVVRMNLRNCGGTEQLASTLYNAGQSDDIAPVAAALDSWRLPRPHLAAGFSLGGNVLLRYAAVAGAASRLDAVAGVNPPIDLALCARSIELPANRLYQWYYTIRLCNQLRRIQESRGAPGPPVSQAQVRTIRRFDEIYTAPDAGQPSAEAYYATASAGPRLPGLRTRALILSARDDPFVPMESFLPHHGKHGVRFLHPDGGGHCGYWQGSRPHYWAARTLLEFFEENSPPASPGR